MLCRAPYLTLLTIVMVVFVATVPTLWRVPGAPALLAWQSTGSTVSPAQAAPFIGDWTAAITSQMGPSTYLVSVKVEGGSVVASVTGGIFPRTTVSDISLVGKNLFLKYASDFQGTLIPSLIAMTPQGQNMLLTISLMDGQFEMAGTATKGGAPASGAAAGRGPGGSGAESTAQGGGRGPAAQPQVAARDRPAADDVRAPRERPGDAQAAALGARACEGRGLCPFVDSACGAHD